MADKKISELTALTGAALADTDLIPVVDTSATTTKKISLEELKIGLDTPSGFIRKTGGTFSGNIRFEGDTGSDALIKKNASSGRDELQIYAAGDANTSGSRGAGMQLYGNYDNEHDGNIAFITGPDDEGAGRMFVSGWDTNTHVTIGNGPTGETIWEFVDNHKDKALLNLINPTGGPALFIMEANGTTEGDITVNDGESMQFGHWNYGTSTYTHRMSMTTSGLDVVGDITAGGVVFGTGGPSPITSNTLNDYEEGTWTPVISDATSGGNTGTATVAYATYTKVGNLVYLKARLLNMDTTGMGSGNIYVQGVPFAADGDGQGVASMSFFTAAASSLGIVPSIDSSASYIKLKEVISGGVFINADSSQFTSGTADLWITITYNT